jgi:type II secretory pathway pseudopilin PulG
MSAAQTFRRNAGSRRQDEGYILLTLMLMCAMVIIALAAIGPQLTHQLKRDREEEMIHRGVQYSRAIRKFYKKTGRYPVRLEELENTNNLRFIRQKYKDPITGEDFKLLHFGEIKTGFGGGIAGASNLGAAASMTGGLQGANNPQAQAQALLAAQMQTQIVAQMAAANASDPQNLNGSDAASSSGSSGSSSKSGSNPVFGGGPIVGVVSTSKKESIRQFNKKNHYNDWQFIYDPSSDRGGLLNTPAQPVPFNQNVGGTKSGVPGVPTLGGAGGIQPTPQPVQQPTEQPPQEPQ